MKRRGYLIEEIAAIQNLELAYYKARLGKAAKDSVYAYGQHLKQNLKILQAQILSGQVDVGGYRYFTIYDPKRRQICAAPFAQRVLHHALMNVCHPYFEKRQIADSYASRLGKGTYAALEKAKYFQKCYPWFLKLDVRKYFDSIRHDILRKQLCSMFKDGRLFGIFDAIIDSYEVEKGRGLPIGNLTSQYFANHYLSPADHFAKEKFDIPAYVRYMDDMVLWHDDKETLLKAGYVFKAFVEDDLKVELKPFCLNKREEGLPFLGYRLLPDEVRLAPRSKKRFKDKFELYAQLLATGVWSQKEFQRHITPLGAFVEQADTWAFRNKLYEKYELLWEV
ncbi:MAG: RNA-directed DNA polymerase [Saprospiraceae bacterium]|nr:RNA-directed DNA polymerase [Saprospiraceae bacterium]